MIKLTNISKTYKGTKSVKALTDVSFEIEQGEFFCLVGPSGCGKSTILKIIAELEAPTGGTVETSGKVSMVFQSAGLLPWLTVRQNVEFGMKMHNFSKTKIEQQASKYLQLVNLSDLQKKYSRELSGGQKQRVGLARALAVEPEILLLDEPFSALDTITTGELHNYLLKIWQETGKTIVMVSHLLEEAVLLSDRVGIMKEGKLIKILTIDLPRPRKEEQKDSYEMVTKIKKEFIRDPEKASNF